MAKINSGSTSWPSGFVKRDRFKKKTSIGGNYTMIKTSSMNKHKRCDYKKYRGQGR